MELTNPGIYGAKRQTVHKTSPRNVLARMLENTTTKDEQCLLEEFKVALRDDPDCDELMGAIIEYWFANNYRSLMLESQTTSTRQERKRIRQKRQADVTEKLRSAVAERAQLLLLEMTLPNGKELADCTGKECVTMGPRVGAFLTLLGKSLKPTQRVGDVYESNAQLKKFWNKAR